MQIIIQFRENLERKPGIKFNMHIHSILNLARASMHALFIGLNSQKNL